MNTTTSGQKVFEPFQFNYNVTNNYYCCCKDNKQTDIKLEPKVFQKFFPDDTSNVIVTSNASITNNPNKIIDNKRLQYRKFNAKKYLEQRKQNQTT